MFNWIKKFFQKKPETKQNVPLDSFSEFFKKEHELESLRNEAKINHSFPLCMETLRDLFPESFYEQFTDDDIKLAYEIRSEFEARYGVYDPKTYERMYQQLLDQYPQV